MKLHAHATPFNVYPEAQLAQIAALSEVQAVPVAAVPSVHVQVFAVQATPSTWNPVAQLAQIAEAEVQGAPTAAVPSVQVQVKVA